MLILLLGGGPTTPHSAALSLSYPIRGNRWGPRLGTLLGVSGRGCLSRCVTCEALVEVGRVSRSARFAHRDQLLSTNRKQLTLGDQSIPQLFTIDWPPPKEYRCGSALWLVNGRQSIPLTVYNEMVNSH